MGNTDVETQAAATLEPRENSGIEKVGIEHVADGTFVAASAVSSFVVSHHSEARVENSEEELELVPFEMEQLSFVEVESSDALNRGMDEIPNQLEFKIGTAADLVGVKPYVLRFWETEFDGLRPKKSRKGQRVYSRRDVETAMIIKKLLYEDRFSIEGARSRLRELRSKVKEERGQQIQQVQAVEARTEVVSGALLELRAIREELAQFRSRIA